MALGSGRMRRGAFLALAAAAALAATLPASPAAAQDFPQAGRPIALIVPFAAGGTTDVSARLLAAFLERDLAVPVQVVNRPGATTQIGNAEVARARPDGHTLAVASLPSLAMTYLDAERRAPYNRDSFTPVAHFVADANMLIVPANSPHASTAALVAAARAAPRRIRVGTVGLMSNAHLPGVALERVAGVEFAFVHFNGGAPLMTALLGGNVDAGIVGSQVVIPQARAGTVRPIATIGNAPSPFFPDVQTLRAQGFDVSHPSSFVVVGPAGMETAVVAKLSDAVRRALDDGEIKRRLAEQALSGVYMDAAALAAFWADVEARQRPLIDLARQQR